MWNCFLFTGSSVRCASSQRENAMNMSYRTPSDARSAQEPESEPDKAQEE
jgi:hypothetical protein